MPSLKALLVYIWANEHIVDEVKVYSPLPLFSFYFNFFYCPIFLPMNSIGYFYDNQNYNVTIEFKSNSPTNIVLY